MKCKKMIPIEDVRSGLFLVWSFGAGIPLLILILQSLAGRYGAEVQSVWSWFIPTVVPSISLMLGVLGATALSGESTKDRLVRTWSALLFRDSGQDRPAANEQILLSINYRRAFSLDCLTRHSTQESVLDKSV
jgi:hypothetical protein